MVMSMSVIHPQFFHSLLSKALGFESGTPVPHMLSIVASIGFLVWLLVESLLIVDYDQILPLFLVSPIPVHFVYTFDD